MMKLSICTSPEQDGWASAVCSSHTILPHQGLFGDNKNLLWLMEQTILSWDNVRGLWTVAGGADGLRP